MNKDEMILSLEKELEEEIKTWKRNSPKEIHRKKEERIFLFRSVIAYLKGNFKLRESSLDSKISKAYGKDAIKQAADGKFFRDTLGSAWAIKKEESK